MGTSFLLFFPSDPLPACSRDERAALQDKENTYCKGAWSMRRLKLGCLLETWNLLSWADGQAFSNFPSTVQHNPHAPTGDV